MPIPRISNNTANIYGASLRYEQNGKTQNPLNPNLVPEPIDFTGWVVGGAAVILSSNSATIGAGLSGELKLTHNIDPGASYKVTIIVEQDVAIANNLVATFKTSIVPAVYKTYTKTLSQGSNSFTFIMHKNGPLSAGESLFLSWGAAVATVLTFKKIEFKKCPTTKVVKRLDTFDSSSEGANVWKMVALQLGSGGGLPQLGTLVANNISSQDCVKLKAILFPIGTEIMGDFTSIQVLDGNWKIYMKLPRN